MGLRTKAKLSGVGRAMPFLALGAGLAAWSWWGRHAEAHGRS